MDPSKADGAETPALAELASLIGSLNMDLERPDRRRTQTSSDRSASSKVPSGASKGVAIPEDRAASSHGSSGVVEDREDFTVLHFGAKTSLRGEQGRYLAAQSVTGTKKEQLANGTICTTTTTSFILGINGQGIGEQEDALVPINADNREDTGPIRYGQTIYLRSTFAKERLLCRIGANEGSTRVGFVRNLAGQAEKWVILKAAQPHSYGSRGYNSSGGDGDPSRVSATPRKAGGGGVSGSGSSGGAGCEEEGDSYNSFVRIGDRILLQSTTPMADYILSLHEGVDGREVRLQHKDRVTSGYDYWHIELHGSPALPSWHKRPYLSGRYLIIPPAGKILAPEIEARYFHSSSSGGGAGSNTLSRLTGATSTQRSSILSGGRASNMPPAPPPLNTLDLESQHEILMRELVLALSGFEGDYIRIAAPSSSSATLTASSSPSAIAAQCPGSPYLRTVHFVMDSDSADKSIISQVGALLPTCESVIRVKDFIRVHSRYEYGLVSHAFTTALRNLMTDYENVVIQLECLLTHRKLTLQKMVYFLQPSRVVMRHLDKLCSEVIRDATGGHLVDLLYQAITEQGDEKARELHIQLFHAAAEPYFKMLQLWLFRGELHDVYNEFMIHENPSLSKESMVDDFNAAYWDEHYTITKDVRNIPRIFIPFKAKILSAGKYLNVVRNNILVGSSSSDNMNMSTNSYTYINSVDESRREYDEKKRRKDHKKIAKTMERLAREHPLVFVAKNKSNNNDSDMIASWSSMTSAVSRAVASAHDFSSRALLKLLEEKYSLSAHLRSLRRFFLLEHGDFFVQFMDTADDELRRDIGDVSISRVQSLLQQALQTSTLHSDPYKDLLTCSLAPHNLIQHLHLIQSAGGVSGGHDGGGAASASAAASASLMLNASPSSGLAAVVNGTTSSTMTQGLKGVEALVLDYRVDWPLSIVLSRRSFTKYQLLSRLLFFSKHVEVRVLSTWCDFQETKCLNIGGKMHTSYALRHRMLHFLQNFVYYMCLEVIGPRAHEMVTGLETASNMDEVIALHDKFLDMCLKECLLASQNLLKILTKIMTTCLLFSDQMKRFAGNIAFNNGNLTNATQPRTLRGGGGASLAGKNARSPTSGTTTVASSGGVALFVGGSTSASSASASASSSSSLEKSIKQQEVKAAEKRRVQSAYVVKEVTHEVYKRLLNKFAETFDAQLYEFLDTLWKDSHRYHAQLSNLCVRLDYNGFYSGRSMQQGSGGTAGLGHNSSINMSF